MTRENAPIRLDQGVFLRSFSVKGKFAVQAAGAGIKDVVRHFVAEGHHQPPVFADGKQRVSFRIIGSQAQRAAGGGVWQPFIHRKPVGALGQQPDELSGFFGGQEKYRESKKETKDYFFYDWINDD